MEAATVDSAPPSRDSTPIRSMRRKIRRLEREVKRAYDRGREAGHAAALADVRRRVLVKQTAKRLELPQELVAGFVALNGVDELDDEAVKAYAESIRQQLPAPEPADEPASETEEPVEEEPDTLSAFSNAESVDG